MALAAGRCRWPWGRWCGLQRLCCRADCWKEDSPAAGVPWRNLACSPVSEAVFTGKWASKFRDSVWLMASACFSELSGCPVTGSAPSPAVCRRLVS